MTKKHYEAIASIIECNTMGQHVTTPGKILDNIAEDLADYFATDNPRFDRDKFMIACGFDHIQ